jgi:hypothetical protein
MSYFLTAYSTLMRRQGAFILNGSPHAERTSGDGRGRRAAIQFIARCLSRGIRTLAASISILDVFFIYLENGSSNCAEAFRNALTRLQVTGVKGCASIFLFHFIFWHLIRFNLLIREFSIA